MNIVYLEPNQVPKNIRLGYAGRKFSMVVTETVTIPATAGLWDGGSRDQYFAIDLATGEAKQPDWLSSGPFDPRRITGEVKLRPGYAAARWSTFAGKDAGITYYIHPEDATKLLPPAIELDDVERLVLVATKRYKSSYGGRDRYEMATYDWPRTTPYPTRADWDAAKARLIERGLLNRRGAITTAGKNAVR